MTDTERPSTTQGVAQPSPTENNLAVVMMVSGVGALLLGGFALAYKYYAYSEPLMPRLVAGYIGPALAFLGVLMLGLGLLLLKKG